MNRTLRLRKLRNLRDQMDMLLMEGGSWAGWKTQEFFMRISNTMWGNFLNSVFVEDNPELKSFIKTLEVSAIKGADHIADIIISYAGKTQDQMWDDSYKAGKEAAKAATGRDDYMPVSHDDYWKMTPEQRTPVNQQIDMYWKVRTAAEDESIKKDFLDGISAMYKDASIKAEAYIKGYQDGKASVKDTKPVAEKTTYKDPVAQQAYEAGRAGGDEGLFTKMVNSLKTMYNKGLEYWHKFSTSKSGQYIGYTFLCLGMACAFAMVLCLLLTPGEEQRIIDLLKQFYSELKNGIAKAFKQGTLKGIMAVLLAPFKIIFGVFKVMSQTSSGRLCLLSLVFLFLAAVMFYGQYLKLDSKITDAK